jgi:hypothetical protein
MARSPCCRTGTRPAGEYFRISGLVETLRSATMVSANGMPAWRSISQGRRDQDE